jgi:hypothetical protein
MLKIVHDEAESNATSGSAGSLSLLDEIVRDGARQMLAAALQAEVAAYVERFTDEVDEAGQVFTFDSDLRGYGPVSAPPTG